MRRFEFVGGTSNKFWEVEQSGTKFTVHFGRIGTKGQTQTKDLGSIDAAAERVRKLVDEKLGEGYQEVAVAGGASLQLAPDLPPYEPVPMPEDGPATIGTVQLPPGRRLKGDPTMAAPGAHIITAPVVWATDGPVGPRTVFVVREAAAARGWVPVLLAALDSDVRRPWDTGEFNPTDPRRIDSIGPARELAEAWRASFEDGDEESLAPVAPFGKRFPGLAAAPPMAAPGASDDAVLAHMPNRRLGLVAAIRPADVITAIGWMGAVNVHQDTAPMSAILRSWEDRWAARLVEIGFDTLTLTVGNPPQDDQTSLALAAEHFAFCPDNVYQGSETLVAYAKGLRQNRTWEFWWD